MIDSSSVSENHQHEIPISPSEQRQQLQRILQSGAFRNAPGLQKFLDYVTCKTIDGLSGEIKEYAIGADVFGKPAEYDTRVDTTVRVQANRLREKLKRYYEGEGSADDILLTIPKGHYIPSFSRRAAIAGDQVIDNKILTEAKALGPTGRVRLGLARLLRSQLAGFSSGILGLVLLLGGLLLLFRPAANRARAGLSPVGRDTLLADSIDSPLAALWSDFLKQGSSPIVAYSNSEFLATENSDLLRVQSEEVDNAGAPARSDVARRLSANRRLLDHAGPVFFEDLYTGTGEVMAVFYITRLFTQAHSPLGVKRCRLVTVSDLSQHDVIFLGSTVENNLLAKLPLTQDFEFVLPPNAPHLWGCRVVNLHPQPGESSLYETERDRKTQVLRADYALVSFLPGLGPSRRIAVLGGLTTIGTQAAADFASSAAGSAELLARLGTRTPAGIRLPPFFQALLRVDIMKGDVLRVEYVTGHVIQAGPLAQAGT